MSIPKLFNIETDVPTCSGTPDRTCLTKAQKEVSAKIHAGVRNKKGEHLYVNFLWDAGISGEGNSLIDFVLGFDMDSDAQKTFVTDSVYRESAMSSPTLTESIKNYPDFSAKPSKFNTRGFYFFIL